MLPKHFLSDFTPNMLIYRDITYSAVFLEYGVLGMLANI